MERACAKVEHKLRVDAYDHAQKLDLSWHEKQTTGNISAILNDDINQLEIYKQWRKSTYTSFGFYLGNRKNIFFYISPIIAMIAVLPVPIIF